MRRILRALALNACRALLVAVILAVWEWGFAFNARYDWLVPNLLDPYFVSRPSEIWARFLRLACLASREGGWTLGRQGAFAACLGQNPNNLWIGTLVTLKNTFWGFVAGSASGVLVELGPPEDQPHIFERFFRGAHPGVEGSGLGLAIVHSIAQAHGGKVWVESQPGAGSNFLIELPRI